MLEDYFSLQLKFAMCYAVNAAVPVDVAIDRCTNLRRRLNLWGDTGASRWALFLDRVKSAVDDHAEQVALCAEFQRPLSYVEVKRSFGCFSYDPPDAHGTLRIHFVAPDGISSSPLAIENSSARRAELQDLISYVQRTELSVTTVRGVSWLYNLQAYRRLFPAAYSASVQSARFPLHLNGSSTWGQVLNWRQEVKPAVRDQLLVRLRDMEVATPWLVFPLQALVATSQIEVFYDQLT
ncbi:hypothetical protein LJR129_004663 [Acidovorax sp. LjRoot129]|uniref:hypothetical protein n=1 Tax=Acidovorax sp. LjRoot129 TaxID=3342260 RepID=UPI003ED11CE4